MIEKTITLYKFLELSEEAKQNAINDYRKDLDYPWYDEAIASLKGFADKFGVTIKDYRLGYDRSHDFIVTDAEESIFDEYDPNNIKANEFYTGYYMDHVLIQGFINGLKKGSSFEAFNHSLDYFIDQLRLDVDHFFSDAAISENLIDNDYYFNEFGEIDYL